MDILIVLRTRYSSTVVILYIALCCHFNHMSISFANPIEILYWNVSIKRYHTGGVSHHCRTFGMVFIIKNRQILGCHHRHRLIFKDCHDSLITLLLQMLEPNGLGLFFQPKRSGTMGLFVEKASLYFNVEIIENYSEEVWLWFHRSFLEF